MSPATSDGRSIALAFAATAALLAAWMMVQAAALLRADWLVLEPRYRLAQWSGGAPWTPADWGRMAARLEQALLLTPANPVLHDQLSALYALRGRAYWHDDVLRRAYYREAARHWEISLRLRPVDGRAWISLALARSAAGDNPAAVFAAQHRALLQAPHDPAVQSLAISILLWNWPAAPADLRQWLWQLRADPARAQRLRIDARLRAAGIAPPQ